MRGNKPLQTIGCLLSVFGVCFGIYFLAFEYPRMAALQGAKGRSVTGHIVRLHVEKLGRSIEYQADILFNDGQGKPHQFTGDYEPSIWSSLQEGADAQVKYLDTDPNYAIESRSYKAHRSPTLILALICALFIVGLLLLWIGRFARKG